jgi:predicted HNH restriction endonuclease
MPRDDKHGLVRTKTPTTRDYVKALKQVVRSDSTNLRMLQFHYWQPERTSTYDAMSTAMKFKGRFAANVYGKLGRRVGEHLGWVPKHPIEVLVHLRYPEPERKCHWQMRGRLAEALERLGWVGDRPKPPSHSGERPEQTSLFEGAMQRVVRNRYERNPTARRACVAHYGAYCLICGFNFEAAYGPTAAGFIHVHHIEMMKANKRKAHKIDPLRDLRPVCPNCHAVIHLKPRPYTIREVTEMVRANRPSGWVDPPEVG